MRFHPSCLPPSLKHGMIGVKRRSMAFQRWRRPAHIDRLWQKATETPERTLVDETDAGAAAPIGARETARRGGAYSDFCMSPSETAAAAAPPAARRKKA
jgi:porphobilinogen deaminase